MNILTNKAMTGKELPNYFKSTLEPEKIQLDNLDWARLVFSSKTGKVVVRNEHGTEFPVEDLSEEEIKLFYENIFKIT